MERSIGIDKSHWLVTLASVAIVVGALYLAKGILLPLILAGMISFVLSPVCNWLERRRLGRIPAIIITVVLTFATLGIIGSTAVTQMAQLAPKITEYQGNIEAKLKTLTDSVGSSLRSWTKTQQKISEQIAKAEEVTEARNRAEHPYSVRLISSPPSALELFGGMFGAVLEALASMGIVIILVLFFLMRREDLRDRFIRLVGQGRVTGTTQALEDAANRVSRYLLMQLVVNVVFGIAVTIGLHWIGLPNALLWGILTAALKFIPYIGVWIAAAAPTCLSLAISNGWSQPILAFGWFALLEFFVGNFLEPWLFGKHTGVSAVAILVAAVFWSWLWGGVGLLLATPLTVCLLVIGKYVPRLSFLDVLLGDEPVFDWKTRVYQRLLAGDEEEATELIEQYCVDRPLIEVYDMLVIPVLCQAEKDSHRGEIDIDRRDFILKSLRSIVEDLGDSHKQLAASKEVHAEDPATAQLDPVADEQPRPSPVICIVAFSEADEIVALMIAQLRDLTGATTQIIPHRELITIDGSQFEDSGAEIFCLSAMPPAPVTRARKAYRRLSKFIAKSNLIVGLWNFEGDLVGAAERIGCGTKSCVVSTLAVALEPMFSPEPAEAPLATKVPVLSH